MGVYENVDRTSFTVFLRIRRPFYESVDTQGREIIRNSTLWVHKYSMTSYKTIYGRDYGIIGLEKINPV